MTGTIRTSARKEPEPMSIYTIARGGDEEFAGHEFVYEATTDLCSDARGAASTRW